MSGWVDRARERKARDALAARLSVASTAASARRELARTVGEDLTRERRRLEADYLKATTRRSRAFLASTVRDRDGHKVNNPNAAAAYRRATDEVHRLAGRLAEIATQLGDTDEAARWARLSGKRGGDR